MDPTTPQPSQFILPDLISDCHYPLRQNPYRDVVSRASDQWLVDVAQLLEPEIKGYIDMDAGGFAALCYPGADAFHLQVCSDCFNWIFIVDDWMEYGVVNVQEMHESCILALRDPVNFDTEHLGAKMCKTYDYIFGRFRETAGPGCTERFIRGSELFFAAVDLVALKICYPLIEFVAQIDIPDEVVSHPVMKALEGAVNDYASWSNDILSYNKEQSRGDAHWHNIVAVLMHERGLDLQGAIDYAGQMCKDAIQRFDSNRAILPSWDEEVDKQVAIYVEGLQDFMIGALHGHLDSTRYGVTPDRIIKLLPKRPS
ncbi:terpene synthase [Suillus spraguei]|nr:terpene synthase [Suillus spraguei]